MRDKAILAILVAICVVVPGYFLVFPTQAPAVTASVPFAPYKVNMQGQTALAYELEFNDYDVDGLKLKQVDVYAIDNGSLLQSIQGEYLNKTFHARSIPAPTADEMWHGTGLQVHNRLSIFIAISNSSGLTGLRHELTFSWDKGSDIHAAGPQVMCQTRDIPVIGAPLSGSGWMSLESSIATSHHMLGQITENNVTRCPQRYAVDYVKADSNLSMFSGDGTNNADYYCYGEPLIAVADGVITYTRDGIWENVPGGPNANLTLALAGGNMVILDIGNGNYVQYCHAILGSVAVQVGQHVTKGQVLALLGNSGNSFAPHLHFQLGTDPYDLLNSEGLPFLLDNYTVAGHPANTESATMTLFDPPLQYHASWFTNLEWMEYGDLVVRAA
jgi:hypothetical protein